MSLATRTPHRPPRNPRPRTAHPDRLRCAASPERPERLVSLDAYRGFIMLAMASAGLDLAKVAEVVPRRARLAVPRLPDRSRRLGRLRLLGPDPAVVHVHGRRGHALLVRQPRGQGRASRWDNAVHVVFRSVLLVVLGVFLSSNGSTRRPNFTFVNVLSQIGLGYAFVYLLLGRGWQLQLAAAGGDPGRLLAAVRPLPAAAGRTSTTRTVGVKTTEHGRLSGLFAHWNKNTNAAADFDEWFLNLFPRDEAVRVQRGRLPDAELRAVAGDDAPRPDGRRVLRGRAAVRMTSSRWLVVGRRWSCLARRLRRWASTVCPIVKRIWTPSWAVFSTGWTLLMLAGVLLGHRHARLAALGVPAGRGRHELHRHVLHGPADEGLGARHAADALRAGHLHRASGSFLATYGPIIDAVAVLFVLWLVCLWMYRQKVFVRSI